MDFAEARRWMVDGQLRPNKITEAGLLDAMRSLPREAFVPAGASALAYADDEVPLAEGRAMLRPMVLARLLQLAAPRADERVLVVGAGTGYGAAVLARLGLRVVALEPSATLRSLAERALAQTSPGSIRLESGPLADGAAQAAPFDLIFIEGEVPQIPLNLVDQLAEGGRLVALLRSGRGPAQAVQGRRQDGAISLVAAFDASGTSLPGFRPAPAFAF